MTRINDRPPGNRTVLQRSRFKPWCLLLVPVLLAVSAQVIGRQAWLEVIEDFDDGTVGLRSWPGEDVHPDSWRLNPFVTYDSSPYSLQLFGNTWKLESIAPVALDSGGTWQVAAYVERLGEIQGFGLADSAHALLYALAGSEQLDPDVWVTVYQGAFPTGEWWLHRLPVAEDWLARYGYLPTVTDLVFVNDRDSDPQASVFFDQIADVSEDMPVAPVVEAWAEPGAHFTGRDGLKRVTVRFHSQVIDPDSRQHDWFWDFGDDSTSRDSSPVHTYLVGDDHDYTALLEVVDSTGLWGRDSCRVTVDPGPSSFPLTVNFVGDIMLARRYELPGGIIDSLGPEGVFEPTQGLLSAAGITVANLESPLTDEGTRHPTKTIVFRGRPSNVAGLAYAGIDVVSLANNHVIDYGLVGMRETQRGLDSCAIRWFGAGGDAYEAYRPTFLARSGVNFAFLGYSDRTGQYDNYQPFLNAGVDKPGFAGQDTYRIFRSIAETRAVADRVVVQLHAGQEYSPVPGETDRLDDEGYTRFALVPDSGDVIVRRRIIDQGADLVVGHHPHVLQGFEVHRGRLIAHSLGNFAFDQEFPETYPSALVTGQVDRTGFCDFTVTPVYIDDYIPRPALGELGQHILDYLARRSRELGTWLVVDRNRTVARIVLDTTSLQSWIRLHADGVELAPDSGHWVSVPLRLDRIGSISSVVDARPERQWWYRLGRSVVWFGNCEDEGSTLWLLNQPDEAYDTVACRGFRSLVQHRAVGSGPITTNLEERLVCYSDSTRYTLHASLRTDNSRGAGVTVRFYDSRTSPSSLGSANLGTLVSGTTDWQLLHHEFTPVRRTGFLDVVLSSVGPDSGPDGRAWFDDVGIIEWNPWQRLDRSTPITVPNDYIWLQLQTEVETPAAEVSWEETTYDPPTATDLPATPRIRPRTLLAGPCPTLRQATIGYELLGSGNVALRVYNALGQEKRTLVEGRQAAGVRSIAWDGLDNTGHPVAAGAYFCILRVDDQKASVKLVLSR